jgi:hypothetical protein
LDQKAVNAIVTQLEQEGFQKTSLVEAIGVHLFDGRSFEIGEDDGCGGKITEEDIRDSIRSDLESFRPTPDAWRSYTQKDSSGREWTIFQAVEIENKPLSRQKLAEYAELWFLLDAIDELVDIHLMRINEDGVKTNVCLGGLFYDMTEEELAP